MQRAAAFIGRAGERELEHDRGWKPQCRSARRPDADQSTLHLGQAEHGMIGRDDDVAPQHDPETSRYGRAVHRGHDRLRVHTLDEHLGARTARDVCAAAPLLGDERLQVHPGTERALARAGEHDDAHRVVVLGLDEGATQPEVGLRIHCVAALGPVDRDDPDGSAGDDVDAHCSDMIRSNSAKGSRRGSPVTLTTTSWIVPVNRNGAS